MSLLLLLNGSLVDPDNPDIGRRQVTARLLDEDGALIDDLDEAFDIEWYDEENGPGHGSCNLPLSSSMIGSVLPGRFIDCQVAGISRFTFKIEGNPEFKVIQRGEEKDQIVSLKGRGWACVLDEVITLPEPSLTLPLPTSFRLFSAASIDFPNEVGWGKAVELYDWVDGVSPPDGVVRGRYQLIDGNLYPSPVNFPWAVSPNNYDETNPPTYDPPGGTRIPVYWIWSESGYSTEEFGIGWCFFRSTFTLSSPALVTFDVTADNFFTFYLEGVPILGEKADHLIWQGWLPQPIALPAGTYQLAAVVQNVSIGLAGEGVNQNPGGFLAAGYEADSDNVPVTWHFVTNDTWTCEFIASTDRWPGWTPGQIVQKLIDEAVARGDWDVYQSNTFTATLDSNGDAWLPLDTGIASSQLSFEVDIGTSLMHALDELHKMGWINWHVRPGTLLLDIERGRAPSIVPSATLAAGVNLAGLERNATAPYANALLVQWSDGYLWVEDAAAIAGPRGRVEDIFSSDATSEAEAQQAGETELNRRVQSGWPAVVVAVEPTSYADVPYEGYTLGDYVNIPAQTGGTENVRVLAIRCKQDAEGWADWSLELNAKLQVPERRNADLLRQIGGRSQVVQGTVQ